MVKRKDVRSTLTVLSAAIAAYYQAEGDKTKAGVVVACLDYDPTRYYASVARYPDGPFGRKRIVVSTADCKTHRTAEKALDDLALRWYKLTAPPPVETTLDDLARHLATKGE